MATTVSIDVLVPGGIQTTDRWHIGRDDGSCSRCNTEPPDSDVPLLLWANDGHDMLRFCEGCLGTRDQWGSAPDEWDDLP